MDILDGVIRKIERRKKEEDSEKRKKYARTKYEKENYGKIRQNQKVARDAANSAVVKRIKKENDIHQKKYKPDPLAKDRFLKRASDESVGHKVKRKVKEVARKVVKSVKKVKAKISRKITNYKVDRAMKNYNYKKMK